MKYDPGKMTTLETKAIYCSLITQLDLLETEKPKTKETISDIRILKRLIKRFKKLIGGNHE